MHRCKKHRLERFESFEVNLNNHCTLQWCGNIKTLGEYHEQKSVQFKFFRDLQNGRQVLINGEICIKIRPKMAMTSKGDFVPVADNVQVQLYDGDLAA